MFHQQALNKAKIKTVFAGIFVCLLFFSGMISCRKETGQQPGDPFNTTVSDRSETNPTVTNGMLYFDSFSDLETFTKSLQDKESDSVQVRSAYIALGVDVNAEYLPNLTDFPVCLLKEQAIGGYTSVRKAEETVINAALNNGDDNVFSIIRDPYRKTTLNAHNAVKISNRIYKFYPDGGIAIVLNEDWILYNSIKTLTWESLTPSYNLVITHRNSSDYPDYFIIDQNGEISGDKKIFKPCFHSEIDQDGKIRIVNCSAISSTGNSPTFIWNYSDQTTSNGLHPNRTISDGASITVTISNGDGDTQTASPLACSVENFAITPLSNNNFKFGPGFDPANSPYYTKWFFSDGTSQTGVTVTKVFNSNGWVRCEAWRTSDNTKACEFTKNVIVKCGDKKEKTQTHIFNNAGGSGQKWKLDCSIWVLSGEVGCKSKYLKRVGFAWLPANNQGACADISGTYKREVFNPNKNCLDVTASGSKCLGNGTWPTSVSFTIPEVTNVFREPNLLSSGHRIKVNGVWMGPGTGSMPRLVLD